MESSDDAGIANDAHNLTPNPFPSGKGNRMRRGTGRGGEPDAERYRTRKDWALLECLQNTNPWNCAIKLRGAAEAFDHFRDHCGAAFEGFAADVLVGLMRLLEIAGAAD